MRPRERHHAWVFALSRGRQADMNVVVTGGLTGGHVMPCVSLALALRSAGHEVLYIGADGQFEAQACQRYGIPFVGIRFHRHSRFRRTMLLLPGLLTAARAMRRFHPSVIFSKGSVVAVPVVLAGRFLRVPVVAHESDIVPGSETLLLARYCSLICLGHEATRAFFSQPTLITGNMTRPNFNGGARSECLRLYGFPSHKTVVFVTGGSQGSLAINELLYPILPQLTKKYSVVHQCGVGKDSPQTGLRDYVQLEFLSDEIKHIYAASSVVVSRAGAGSLAEACWYRVPMILIPLPTAEFDHQRHNALALECHGLCTILPQDQASPARLVRAIDEVIANRAGFAARYQEWSRADPTRGQAVVHSIVQVLERYATG